MGCDIAPMSDSYGYGLTLSLNSEQCFALGLGDALKPGMVVSLTALATVTSISCRVGDGDGDEDADGNEGDLSLQITDLDLQSAGDKESATSKLAKSGLYAKAD